MRTRTLPQALLAQTFGPNKSVVCCYASHTFPEISENASIQTSSLLYMNADDMMRYKPKISPM